MPSVVREWLFHFEAWLFTGKWEGGGTADRLATPKRPDFEAA